jgi:toxin ParE1/3/4
MPRVHRSKTSLRDAAEIWHYIAMDSQRAADRWLEMINQRINLLAEFPGVGADRSDLQPSLRTFPVGNYLILYRRAKGGIHSALHRAWSTRSESFVQGQTALMLSSRRGMLPMSPPRKPRDMHGFRA